MEQRLVVFFLVSLLLPTLAVGWLGYSSAFDAIRRERIRNVGRVADARREELVATLTGTQARAATFVAELGVRCARHNTTALANCAGEALESFVQNERALGAVLRLGGGTADLTVGNSAVTIDDLERFEPLQIARFAKLQAGGGWVFYIVVADPMGAFDLVVTFPINPIQNLFAKTDELGMSGESYLADAKGYFITKPRYSTTRGYSQPISVRPMQQCLGAKNGELLDPDYRGVAVIHGFRFVPEIGGGCIMANFNQAEAFAPLQALQWRLVAWTVLLVAAAIYAAKRLGRRIVRPILDLTGVTRNIMNGHYDACAVVTGRDEIAELGRTFNRMTERLAMTVGELREHKALLEQRVRTRTGELEAANQKLAALSRSDGLTGLANRRHLDEVLGAEWRRAARLRHPIAMILLDVDKFKDYNDHYGHQAGDDCLRRVASVMTDYAQRAGELAARYGGEEFAIVLPGSDAGQAFALAEMLRQAVEDLAVPHALAERGIVTVSLGLAAVVPDGGEEVSALIGHADKALYRAKAAGRNRVVVAEVVGVAG